MKGKIAFVLGLAAGYVLGTRAGRERYEQIKRGAAAVWNAEPVQRGVTLVRDAVDERAEDVMSFVRRASADAFSSYVKRADEKSRDKRQAERASQATEASDEPAAPKPSGRKPAPSKAAGGGPRKSAAKESAAKASAAKASKSEAGEQPAKGEA